MGSKADKAAIPAAEKGHVLIVLRKSMGEGARMTSVSVSVVGNTAYGGSGMGPTCFCLLQASHANHCSAQPQMGEGLIAIRAQLHGSAFPRAASQILTHEQLHS
jgi:hypothetical protein